ncbi:MAG: GGDEF domain-containing protein [Acidobacteria bacterium]|nr:GGDEF domain-containing protein [Acidobacteriota bacterium]MBI3423912.1 GGDEF domain-containing protein [Acidobacteriota bacterium]
MPDSMVALLRDNCESLLAQLAQTPVERAAEFNTLLEIVSLTCATPGLNEDAFKAARKLGEWYARYNGDLQDLIGQLLLASQFPGEGHLPKQQALLASAIKAYLHTMTRQLQEQAQQDPLTKLFNRAVFEHRWQEELARARRYGRELTLALFDLDQFKQGSGRLGRPAGDEVLCHFATVLQTSLRQSDVAFRYGDDEFATLLPETGCAAAMPILQRLEARLLEACQAEAVRPPFGIRYGFATYPADGQGAGELLRLADARLYEHKRAQTQAVVGSR